MWCKSLEVLNPYEALKEANMPDLKPCPKCKGKPKPRRVGDMKQYWAFFCDACGYTPVKNNEARYTVWGAKRAWNRRAGEEDKHEAD